MFWSLPASAPRVLIVDDDEDTVTSTAILLEKCGFEVETAQDGKVALSRAVQSFFDLVLLDLDMPEPNGYAVAQALKQEAAPPGPLLVAVTGYGSYHDLLRCAAAGFDLHLTKPVEPALLTRLPLLFERAEAALQEAQRLAEEHRKVVSALLHQQLRMCRACVELAQLERRPQPKKRLLLRAAQLCGRMAEKAAIFGSGQTPFFAEIVALQHRIATLAYRSVEPQ